MRDKSLFLIFLVTVTALLGSQVLHVQAQTPRDPVAGFEPPEFERTAQTGYQFLHLPTTARNAALAGIKDGLRNNDVTAIFNNPANLVDVKNIDIAVSNISYIADIQYNTVVAAKNFGRIGVFGLQIATLDIGDMFRTENVFNEQLGLTERSGVLGTFSASNLLIGLSYARLLTDRVSVGGSFNFVQEKLADTKVDNISFNFGIYYETGFKSLRLAMTARNLGPDSDYTGFDAIFGLPQTVRMPIDYRLGIGYDFIEDSADNDHLLSGYLEGVHPNDGPERIHTAVEYKFMNILSVRGGYRFNYDEQGVTAGGGLTFSFAQIKGRFDYAYVDYGRLDVTHLFTVGFAFGD